MSGSEKEVVVVVFDLPKELALLLHHETKVPFGPCSYDAFELNVQPYVDSLGTNAGI